MSLAEASICQPLCGINSTSKYLNIELGGGFNMPAIVWNKLYK